MKITLNGEARDIGADSLPALIAELNLQPHALLVEHNGTALRPSEWENRPINEGDRIEFIRIVAGG